MKRIVALLLTVLIVAAIMRWQSGNRQVGDQPSSPADCVRNMFESAMRGDVGRYLGCFLAAERDRLAREFSGQSNTAASDALRRSVADLKGWALINPPAAEPASPCVLTVEWVYATRVDRQRLELRKESHGWRIARAETAQPELPKIPYGTPVSGPVPMSKNTSKSSSQSDQTVESGSEAERK